MQRASDNGAEGTPELAAGDVGHAGADQGPKWKRNNSAHTPGSLTPAVMAQNGGEPEKSGRTNSAKRQNAKCCSAAVLSSRCHLLGITRSVPEVREEPEAAGEALAAEELAGREEESEGVAP